MAIRTRVERLEQERRFEDWLQSQRYLEFLSDEQLEVFAVLGFFPDPPPAEPSHGMSRLDSLPRKELVKMFEAAERKSAGRSDEEKLFFVDHAHWPGVTCETSDCQKRWSDELRRKHQSKSTSTEGMNAS